MTLNKKKIVEYIVYGICALFLLWIFVSFAEIVMHNLESGYVYHKYNAINMFVDACKEYHATR